MTDRRFQVLILGLIGVQLVWLVALTAKVFPGHTDPVGRASAISSAPTGQGAWAPRGGQTTMVSSPGAPSPGANTSVEAWFRSLLDPLEQAAVDHGDAPDDVLPSKAAVLAAIDSGSLQSDASRSLIDTLRAAYGRYGMPFPDVEAAAPPGEPPDNVGTDAQIVEALLRTTADRLRRAAEDAGEDPATWLPEDAAMAAASKAGSLDAPEVQAVIATLRRGYARFDLAFPDLAGPE